MFLRLKMQEVIIKKSTMNCNDKYNENNDIDDIILDDIQIDIDEMQAILEEEENALKEEIDWDDSVLLD